MSAPLVLERIAETGQSHLRPFVFHSIGCTHPGCVRQLNEDACLDRSDRGLWAVADGMGGHSAGDVASKTVIDALAGVSSFGSAFAFRRAVRSALETANAVLQEKAVDELSGPCGATVVALLAHGGHYACIWAGDSRAYVLRQGKLERITRDHSLVQELIDAGALTYSDARKHSQAHVVTRAVGAHARLDLDGVYGRIESSDRFLLCSDGLAGLLNDQDLAECLLTPSPKTAADSLMQVALERGAPDNVTFMLIDTARCEPSS